MAVVSTSEVEGLGDVCVHANVNIGGGCGLYFRSWGTGWYMCTCKC